MAISKLESAKVVDNLEAEIAYWMAKVSDPGKYNNCIVRWNRAPNQWNYKVARRQPSPPSLRPELNSSCNKNRA